MAAQREEINKLKETIQEDLVTTDQRIDSLMTDLVLIPPEGSEPPQKKRKLSVNITSATSGAATGNSVCDPVSRSADDLNSVPDTAGTKRPGEIPTFCVGCFALRMKTLRIMCKQFCGNG